MARLVLFGATGYAGSRILDEAVRRGHQVTAVARNVDTIPERENVRAVAGSLYDAELVRELTVDADVLISAIPSRPTNDGRSLLDTVPTLVDVARHNKVRLAVVGGASSLLRTEGGEQVFIQQEPTIPPEILPEITLHMEFLDVLQRTPADVDWFYLSPPIGFGSHVPGKRLGRYRVGTDVVITDEQGDSAISGEDYAIAMLDEIETPRHHHRRFTVGY
jgi:putative NADH-flavin reductase